MSECTLAREVTPPDWLPTGGPYATPSSASWSRSKVVLKWGAPSPVWSWSMFAPLAQLDGMGSNNSLKNK